MRILDIFAQKSLAVSKGIQRLAVKSSTSIDDKTLKVLVEAYMLPVQCLWYRIPNDSKVDMLISKFEKFMPQAITLIAKHGFDNLVFTFRGIYTNLYISRHGQGRTYSLSVDSFDKFLQTIQKDGTLVLTAKKYLHKQAKTQTISNSFSQVLKVAENVAKKVPQVEQPKVEAPSPKVETKTEIKKGGYFVEVSIGELTSGKFDKQFIKLTIADKNRFGHMQFTQDAKVYMLSTSRKVEIIAIADISKAQVYTKAVR